MNYPENKNTALVLWHEVVLIAIALLLIFTATAEVI